ncbi:MAG: aspartate carbamoyltransferase catalytic subunit [Defluviitaleaceae bacterium]|nr:aspartate carbamoyltransferase catalytic subunit [Defluviitaleaceae bacterium]
MTKDLLGIRDLSREDIFTLLEAAKKQKPKVKNRHLRDHTLAGASIATLFYENSTRTKMSFLLAGEYLGAYADDLNIATSSVAKGETLIDTGLTLEAMGVNAIVMRHSMTGAAHLLAQNVKCSVINGGDGSNEHPTQALLDAFTIWEHKQDFEGLNVTIVGDIANSRVARSNIFLLTKFGARVTLAGPATLLNGNMRTLGANMTTNVAEAIQNADVIMGLRVQLERQKGQFPSLAEYAKFFGINLELLRHTKKDAIIMHPAPVNRGVEISSGVMDCEASVIYQQVENGVAMRMAILDTLIGGQA